MAHSKYKGICWLKTKREKSVALRKRLKPGQIKNLQARVDKPIYYFVSLTPEAAWGGFKKKKRQKRHGLNLYPLAWESMNLTYKLQFLHL